MKAHVGFESTREWFGEFAPIVMIIVSYPVRDVRVREGRESYRVKWLSDPVRATIGADTTTSFLLTAIDESGIGNVADGTDIR